MSDPESFLNRWSRRKQASALASAPASAPAEGTDPHPGALPQPQAEQQEQASPLTLADADSLTLASDFKPFLAPNVAPEVKNAAFRKLFADPHFNVMDRLDIYIDDYSNPAPLLPSTLRQMASAKFMNLFEEEEEIKEKESAAPAGASASETQASQPVDAPENAAATPASQPHDDPQNADLRLQPDDAARAEDARDGAG